MNLLQGYFSLGSGPNTVDVRDTDEGVVSDLLPELSLDMTDEELINLKRDWLKTWEPYRTGIEKLQTDNENYWLGAQYSASNEKRKIQDNLIFEALETYLPIATRPKAAPVVESDNSPEGRALAEKVRKMLSYIQDTLSYNLKLKQVTRYWALYMLGCLKVGWSMKENDITCVSVRPQKLVLDPKATVEEGEYNGYYVGEYLDDMASDLIARFPAKRTFITDKVKDKLGTSLSYIMWTTDEYVFWTLDDEVLGKNKNPHWNYETETPGQMDEMGQPGQPTKAPGKNHFKNKKKPYIFLTFFNLGKQPHDDTNLIQQNIPLQDLINKRLVQIDLNADNANGGLAISGDSFTPEQAAKAAQAKRKGGVIYVPTGPVGDGVANLQGEQLPQFVYQSLLDYRNELRNVFGTRGSSPQGTISEKTVGGKVITKTQDTDRIGGGISVYLEEFTDLFFNWCVQLMYVYYDEAHSASILGREKAQEYITLSSAEFTSKLLVGVKEGSMIPHDPASERQEALELWSGHGIDPISFFERLDFPNPRESAKNLFLWLSDPIQLFPELAQAAAQSKQPEQKPANVTVNFKDMPPVAQAQELAKIGIQIDPQAIVQHEAGKLAQENLVASHEAQRQAILSHQTHQHTLTQSEVDAGHQQTLQAAKPVVAGKAR